MRSASVFSLVILIDRLLKNYTVSHLSANKGFAIIPGVFHWTRVNNSGAAFGFLKQNPLFLVLVSLFFVLFLGAVWFLLLVRQMQGKAVPDTVCVVAWSLIGGGAFGNLCDRMVYGYVIDFLDFRVWPVFNLADSAIFIGVVILLWGVWQKERSRARQAV